MGKAYIPAGETNTQKLILEGKSKIITTRERDRETEREGERDKERREKLMVGRLKKEFIEETAMELKCEERFEPVENAGSPVGKGKHEQKSWRAKCRAKARNK